jgi:SAM-dependent methyltransferase
MLFLKYFPKKCSVLDIGFGSGRDLLFLKDNNYDIWGIDPSEKFIINSQKKFPNLLNHFTEARVPFLYQELPFKKQFDAIIIIAMWMHLKLEEYEDVINSIVSIANSNSTIIISYSKGDRAEDERYFENVDIDYITKQFKHHNFTLIKSINNKDSLNRDALTWITVVFKHD